MNHCCDYFQLSNSDNQNIQAIKSKWRFQSNSIHVRQPQFKIHTEEQPKKTFQLPDVFMTTRQNLHIVEHNHMIQKESKLSLSSLEVSPNIPFLNKSKDQKYKELTDLQKRYSQYKKQFHKVKKYQQPQQFSVPIISKQESLILYNGIKLPYNLYIINKNRQLAINNLMQNGNGQVEKQSKQQIEMIDNEINKVRNDHQNRQKLKEYRSRSYLDNIANNSMLCVNQVSKKKRQKKIIQRKYPIES